MDQEFKEMFIELKADLLTGMDAICGRLEEIGQRLEHLEQRMVRLDERMEQLEGRMEHLEQRMVQLDERMVQLEGRMEHLEQRVDCLEGRVDALETGLAAFKKETEKNFRRMETRFAKIDKRFDQIGERFERVDDNLDILNRKTTEIIDMLNYRFRLADDKVELLKGNTPPGYNRKVPIVHTDDEEPGTVQEFPAPYMIHNIDVRSTLPVDGTDSETYLLARFAAAESVFRQSKTMLIFEVQRMERMMRLPTAGSPSALVEGRELHDALNTMVFRLIDFVCIPPDMDRLKAFVRENGMEALQKMWDEKQLEYKETEGQAYALIQKADEFMAKYC